MLEKIHYANKEADVVILISDNVDVKWRSITGNIEEYYHYKRVYSSRQKNPPEHLIIDFQHT